MYDGLLKVLVDGSGNVGVLLLAVAFFFILHKVRGIERRLERIENHFFERLLELEREVRTRKSL